MSQEWVTGLLNVLQPEVMFFLTLGVVAGLFIGALPGLTATMGIAILTPMTFMFEPTNGFAMLIGVWNAAIFAGGITAILINTPGTPASIAQTFDGNHLYRQGKGGLALGINVIYSAYGGIIGSLVLIFFSFPLARFAVTFGPTEYFALAFLGLTMMAAVSGNSIIKGMLVGATGILVSTIGLDSILMVRRYTMGTTYLLDGLMFLPIMIGMFGIGDVLDQIYEHRASVEKKENDQRHLNLGLGRVIPTLREFAACFKLTTTFALFGSLVGAIPAAGADIASIISWGQARKWSKHPEEYGKGSVEGLAVATVSSNSVLGGALCVMLTLGIPADAVSAVLIGSLMMYGLEPGYKIFTDHMPFVINIMWLMLLANFVFLVLGLVSAKVSAKVLNVNKRTVWVSICLLCVVGSYALNNSYYDVIVMLVSGLIGFCFKRIGFVPGPFILGLLLGGMLESNLRRALVMSQGSYSVFFTRPISCVLIILTALTLILPIVRALLKKYKQPKSGA